MNKKVISFAAAMMLAALPLAAGSAAGFTAGEYEASAQGFGGPVTVKVTVDADTVTAVEVTGEGETPALGGAAIEGYNTSLVGVTDADSVDVTSGATVTSTAVKEAFADALAQAKGEAVANDAAIAFKAGTYTASAKGYNGDVTVSVTFSDDAVTAIEVTDSSETAHVGDVAFEPMIADMLAANGSGVDNVSGATFSSAALRSAAALPVMAASSSPRTVLASSPTSRRASGSSAPIPRRMAVSRPFLPEYLTRAASSSASDDAAAISACASADIFLSSSFIICVQHSFPKRLPAAYSR